MEQGKKPTGNWESFFGILFLFLGITNLFSGEAFVSEAGAQGVGFNLVTPALLVVGSFLVFWAYKIRKQK